MSKRIGSETDITPICRKRQLILDGVKHSAADDRNVRNHGNGSRRELVRLGFDALKTGIFAGIQSSTCVLLACAAPTKGIHEPHPDQI